MLDKEIKKRKETGPPASLSDLYKPHWPFSIPWPPFSLCYSVDYSLHMCTQCLTKKESVKKKVKQVIGRTVVFFPPFYYNLQKELKLALTNNIPIVHYFFFTFLFQVDHSLAGVTSTSSCSHLLWSFFGHMLHCRPESIMSVWVYGLF